MPESENQSQRYSMIYKQETSHQSALTILKDSKVYLFNPAKREIGAEISQGLIKTLEDSGLFEQIKSDPIKKN